MPPSLATATPANIGGSDEITSCTNVNLAALRKAKTAPDGMAFIIDLLPDFSPVTHDELELHGPGRKINILFQRPVDLDHYFDLQAESQDKNNKLLPIYGLERFFTSFPLSPPFFDHEVFSARDGESTTDLIVCSRDGTVPFPGCEQWFTHKGISLELGYSKIYLQNWQKIRKSASSVVDLCLQLLH